MSWLILKMIALIIIVYLYFKPFIDIEYDDDGKFHRLIIWYNWRGRRKHIILW